MVEIVKEVAIRRNNDNLFVGYYCIACRLVAVSELSIGIGQYWLTDIEEDLSLRQSPRLVDSLVRKDHAIIR